MSLKLLRQDITKMETDAIVNPSNNQLEQDEEIHQAVASEGVGLPAKYIIHVGIPQWIDGKHQEEEVLYQTYQSALTLAKKMELSSVAFPLLSFGNYKFPDKLVLEIAMNAFRDFLEQDELEIYLLIYDKKSLRVSQTLVGALEAYIDEHYVEEKREELPMTFSYQSAGRKRYEEEPERADSFLEDRICESCGEFIKEEIVFADSFAIPKEPVEGLEQLMQQREETFTQMLLRLIDEREMTDAEAYKRANVDRKLFSKIRSNPNYTPSKKTILSFAIALQLSMEETEELLKKAGFAFSNCIKFDVVISFFIEHKMYDIFEINEILFQYDLPLLGV